MRAVAGAAFRPDPASVTRDDPPDDRQADAGAREIVRAMQALEDSEQFVDILHIEAYAIVMNMIEAFRSRCFAC